VGRDGEVKEMVKDWFGGPVEDFYDGGIPHCMIPKSSWGLCTRAIKKVISSELLTKQASRSAVMKF
jgi:hypothetical protein